MSNFLQRIASAVVSAPISEPPRLHPMMGSIFAPVTPLAHLETPAAPPSFAASGETVSSRPQITEFREPVGQPAHQRLAPLVSPAPSHESAFQEVISRPFTVNRNQDWPLLPQDFRPHKGDASTQSATPNAPESGKDLPIVSSDETGPKGRSALPPSGAASEPKASTQSPNSPRLQPLQVSSTVSPSRIAPVRSVPAGPQRREQHDTDEIYIHIGRIEVAAIAPPAPRPTPTPARKSLSLDEYLRGSHGGQT
jgi:hypothetical protein